MSFENDRCRPTDHDLVRGTWMFGSKTLIVSEVVSASGYDGAPGIVIHLLQQCFVARCAEIQFELRFECLQMTDPRRDERRVALARLLVQFPRRPRRIDVLTGKDRLGARDQALGVVRRGRFRCDAATLRVQEHQACDTAASVDVGLPSAAGSRNEVLPGLAHFPRNAFSLESYRYGRRGGRQSFIRLRDRVEMTAPAHSLDLRAHGRPEGQSERDRQDEPAPRPPSNRRRAVTNPGEEIIHGSLRLARIGSRRVSRAFESSLPI